MIVNLTSLELRNAIGVGFDRQKHADDHAVEQYWGREYPPAMRTFQSIFGAVGESAVAKLLNIPWPRRAPSDDFYGSGDVGGVLEVRTRPVPGSGPDLGIRPIDLATTRPFVLCHFLLRSLTVDVVGWEQHAADAKTHGKWDETSGCWYLPPPYRSVESLIKQFGTQESA